MSPEHRAEWFEQLDRVLAHTCHWDDFEADYGTPTPVAMISGLRDEFHRLEELASDPVFAFLLGEGALDLPDDAERRTGGSYAWFGDDVRPPYWWRKRLRSVVQAIRGES